MPSHLHDDGNLEQQGVIMAKRTNPPVRTSKSLAQPALTHSEIARRAYDHYLARHCEHGHDLDDWLQAERELKQAVRRLRVRNVAPKSA